MQALMVTK